MFLSWNIELSKHKRLVAYKSQKLSLFENSMFQERNILFGWNFQDDLKIIRLIYGQNFT